MTKKSILAGLVSALAVIVGINIIAGRMWQAPAPYIPEPGIKTLARAYASQQSGMVVEVQGNVTRLLMDGGDTAREQTFIIEAVNGQVLLVTHNLVDSKKVPVAIGDMVSVRGEYRWSERGGSLLWTTRDKGPNPRHGWIEHKGDRYD